MGRWTILIIAQITSALFFGEMGAYAIIKHPLSQEFNFSESFLGTSVNM